MLLLPLSFLCVPPPSVPSPWRLDDRARSAVSVTPTILALAVIFDEESERRGDAGGSGAREVTRSDDDPPSSCCYVRTNFSASGSLGGRQGFVRRAGSYEGGREGVRFRLKLSSTRSRSLLCSGDWGRQLKAKPGLQ